MSRRRADLKSPARAPEPGEQPSEPEIGSPPETLHQVDEDALSAMQPGDLLMLDAAPSLRTQVETNFLAVLACPRCGQLSLITPPQYFGAIPLICGSNACSCRLRIQDRSRFIYLPLN